MGEYKSADEVPLGKAIEAIMSGALQALAAHENEDDDDVGGFMFEVIAGGQIGPRKRPFGKPGTAFPGSAAAAPGAGSATPASGDYGAG